ncbi:Myo-inositol 2-dehydrogenase [Paenibacillus pasadenensis]|uniref:Myo-inositol 2-dehydrogenase n=1 Tax=Paenibacillus pasadenensis TaxID=217090 RepID=A0A2N5ND60_9BACL|nr:oxidoreductase [Paenibacillus pasadenensis]PLT48285.1 Myo-inositol 2-dehydrogenase [Paenibacillus pasadenensis]
MGIPTGLIGYGLSGAVFHAPLIAAEEGLTLTGVVTSQREKVLEDYPEVQVHDDVESLLASGVELVVVASPNTLHYEHARSAILAGKHVVVEKPFTNTSKEAEELIALAREKGVRLSVFHNRRWDNDFLTVQQVLASGGIGRISVYEAHYDRYAPEVEVETAWRDQRLPGSGILYDLGSHLIDQAVQLLGMPESIWADLRLDREGAVTVDYFHLVLGYPQSRAILRAGTLVRQAGPRYMVHGEQGSYIKYGLDPQEEQLKSGRRPGDEGWGADKPECYGELTTAVGELTVRTKVDTLPGRYEDFYRGIAEAIQGGAAMPVPPEDALGVIRLIEAARRSAKEKRVIELAEDASMA